MEIQPIADLIGHHHPIYSLCANESKPLFYSAGHDKGVVEWDAETPKFNRVLCPAEHTVYELREVPEWDSLIIAQRNGEVQVVNRSTGRLECAIRHHKKPVFCTAYHFLSSEEIILYIGSEDGVLSSWRINKNGEFKEEKTLYLPDSAIRSMAKSPDNKWLVLGTKDGKIVWVDRENLHIESIRIAHESGLTCVRFSPDGTALYTSGRDARMCVFDVSSKELVRNFVPHLYAVYALDFHPTLPIFATASRDKAVKIWSHPDGKLLRSISLDKGFDAHKLSVNSLCWKPDGSSLFTAGDDKRILVWEINFSS